MSCAHRSESWGGASPSALKQAQGEHAEVAHYDEREGVAVGSREIESLHTLEKGDRDSFRLAGQTSADHEHDAELAKRMREGEEHSRNDCRNHVRDNDEESSRETTPTEKVRQVPKPRVKPLDTRFQRLKHEGECRYAGRDGDPREAEREAQPEDANQPPCWEYQG